MLSRRLLANTYGQLTFRWLFAHGRHLDRSSRRSKGPRRILPRESIRKEIHLSEASRREVIGEVHEEELSEVAGDR